jgi:hypothetical protein
MARDYIYVVYGPSAEWGDGVRVLGFASCKQAALDLLRAERANEREYGPRSWRSVQECGGLDRVHVSEWTRSDPEAAFRYSLAGADGLVDYLNALL